MVIFLNDIQLLAKYFYFFFFNDPAPPEITSLPLHDALPICDADRGPASRRAGHRDPAAVPFDRRSQGLGMAYPLRNRRRRRGDCVLFAPVACRNHIGRGDRKSTRLNSSHLVISYAVFCLKKK